MRSFLVACPGLGLHQRKPGPGPEPRIGPQAGHAGLATAFFALLAPAAMICFGVPILRTRTFPRWTGVVLLVAAVTLLGQFAAFRGALPFPQFLAFIALGLAALMRSRAQAPPAAHQASAEAGQPESLPSCSLSPRFTRSCGEGKPSSRWIGVIQMPWWEALLFVVAVIVAIWGFASLVGFRTRSLTRRTHRNAQDMYSQFADSPRKQRRYARDHGGEWRDE